MFGFKNLILAKKFPSIWIILRKRGKKNLLLLIFMFLTNSFAAISEGFSFSLILLALAILQGGNESVLGIAPALCNTPIGPYLQSLTTNQAFTLFILFAVGLQILRSTLSYVGQIATTFLATFVQAEMQKKIHDQILSMSYSCVSQYKLGDLAEHIKSPAKLIQEVVDCLNRIMLSALVIISSVGMMLWLSFYLAMIAITTFGLLGLSQKFIIRKIKRISHAFTEHMVEFSKMIIQSLHGLKVIHIFNRQEEEKKRAANTLGEISRTIKKLQAWNHIIVPINEIMGVILVGGFLMAGQFVMKDHQAAILPILLTFITILYRLNGRIHLLLSSVACIATQWGQILRLEEVLQVSGKEFLLNTGETFKGFSESISFKNAHFVYPSTQRTTIDNLNLRIEKGSTVALVGHSGAGKSSVLDLLLRLYEPTLGMLEIDGKNVRDFNIYSWREKIGVVSQENFIFNDSIEENIRFGKLDASFEEVVRAAEYAGANEFIEQLPDGYKTIIGERGHKLSGGERQRLSLSRALIRDPEILVLDEATSNLDSHSEWLILQSLAKFRGIKTIIVVAHRLSTIVDADQIFVFEKGRIVESGTHEELIGLVGRYARFWHLQTKNEILPATLH